MPRLALASLAVAVSLTLPQAASAAWNQPVGGPSPINNAADQGAGVPSMAVLDGTPYLAWREQDGDNNEIRVARLNDAGTDWVEVVGGPSPINKDANENGTDPSLAVVEGVLHVAWSEDDGANVNRIRVARLNADGTDWVELVGGMAPISVTANGEGFHPSLASIGGRPWVAWQEEVGAGAMHIHVARLKADGSSWEVAGAPLYHSVSAVSQLPSLASVDGVPHVAWEEHDGMNAEIRAARMPGAFGTAWEKLGTPASSPINHDPDFNAFEPSLASIAGVPHVSWREANGTNFDLRVARFNGADFEEVAGGNPVNHASDMSSSDGGSLADIGGVAYITWSEDDGDNSETRVSELTQTGWDQVVGGASPINHASDQDSSSPVLAPAGGVPYVAWEETDGSVDQIRVARLEPEFLASIEQVSDFSARLSAAVNTYGVPLPIVFQHGAGTALGSQTPSVIADSSNTSHADVSATISGLAPFSMYSWRPAGTDLTRITSAGPARSFTTTDVVPPVISEARVTPAVWRVGGLAAAAPRGTTFRYRLSESSTVTVALRRRAAGRRVGGRCRKPTRRNRRARRCARWVRAGTLTHEGAAGPNSRRFNGRIGRKRLRPARYRAIVVARDPAGNVSTAKRLRFRVVRR